MPLTIGAALSDEVLSKTSLIGAIERVLGVPIKLMEQVVDAALAPRQVAEHSADPRPVAAALLRAHVLRAERRARRARHQLADRPPLSVPGRPLAGGAPELTGASAVTDPLMAYRVGFDVGGTFTDFVLTVPLRRAHHRQTSDEYPDPSDACLAGLDALLERGGVSWPTSRRPSTARRSALTWSSSARRTGRAPDHPWLSRRPHHRPREALSGLRLTDREAPPP